MKGLAVIGPGSQLGRYRLIEPIGTGGMAAVYRAHDPMLEREVAIKILSAALARDRSFRRRFQEEARALGRVEHPNLVRIYAVGREGPVSYYAMELIDGLPLSEILGARGRFSTSETLAVFNQFLQGLEAVHRAGIIHRDIKPANIMLDRSGRVVLMDFGLARRLDRRTLTVAGSVLGTPEYMSPEQACGDKADERSDLYAAGVVLYEMLSGRPPFYGQDTISILRRHVEAPVPPITENVPDLSAPLVRIVERLLEKKPAARYALVSELRADLTAVVRAGPEQERLVQDLVNSVAGLISRPTRLAVVPPPQPVAAHELPRRPGAWRWRWRLTVGATIVAVLALLIAMAAFLRGPSAPRPQAPQVEPTPDIWQEVLLRNGETFTAKFVCTRPGPDGRMMFVFVLPDGRTEEIPASELREMAKGGDRE